MTIQNKEYNVRILFDSEGSVSVGWVHGFTRVNSNCVDFRPVSEKERQEIAGTLGIVLRQSNKASETVDIDKGIQKNAK